MPDTYTAANIRILDAGEAAERFQYEQTAELAEKYHSVSITFISRLVQACAQVSVPVALAEQRYLAKDKSVSVPPELYDAFKALQSEQRR